MKEIIAKLKKIEIRIRKTIESRTHGKFNSIFKGSGIEFSDIRDYQYGDDVRNIDWKVTAKGHGTYIRTYQEEKEQDVIIIADISGSKAACPSPFESLNRIAASSTVITSCIDSFIWFVNPP